MRFLFSGPVSNYGPGPNIDEQQQHHHQQQQLQQQQQQRTRIHYLSVTRFFLPPLRHDSVSSRAAAFMIQLRLRPRGVARVGAPNEISALIIAPVYWSIGSWFPAGHFMQIPRPWRDRVHLTGAEINCLTGWLFADFGFGAIEAFASCFFVRVVLLAAGINFFWRGEGEGDHDFVTGKCNLNFGQSLWLHGS